MRKKALFSLRRSFDSFVAQDDVAFENIKIRLMSSGMGMMELPISTYILRGFMTNEFGLTEVEEHVIKSILGQFPVIEEAVIFGSRARGNYGRASDIDFALKGHNIVHDLGGIIAAFEESSLIYEVDVVDYNLIDSPALKDQIDRFGKRIYCV